jgi:hypothetical protein
LICSSRSRAIRTVGPSETRCGHRRLPPCGLLRLCQLPKCTGPRLGADRDYRHIPKDFDYTVSRLFVGTLRVRRFADGATADRQRRSSLQQVEIVRWLLLVSCLRETESTTTRFEARHHIVLQILYSVLRALQFSTHLGNETLRFVVMMHTPL